MHRYHRIIFTVSILSLLLVPVYPQQNYPIVDTGQILFYSDSENISAPAISEAFFGQDAHYSGNQPSYTDNGDGTITDNVTGLMWEQSMGSKLSFADAFIKADTLTVGGFDDWRVPTLKELYSLILFTGRVSGQSAISFFIDTIHFHQPLGNTDIGEREIDAQTWSSTEYVGETMGGDDTVFGVNFVDGRIKGYPKYHPGTGAANTMYFRMVRENETYGENEFVDNNDGTISDLSTGLMWQKADDGFSRDWQTALAYAENLEQSGFTDWRLPNAKELQSIVDYSRSPQTTNSPAIDPIFQTTEISDPDGNTGHYPFFWTSSTHLDGANPFASAAYIAFGEGLGQMNGNLMDVHGAGCQRSDPKSGRPEDYPQYWGPQGDVRYVYNHVRVVRNISTSTGVDGGTSDNMAPLSPQLGSSYPNPFNPSTTLEYSLSKSMMTKINIYNSRGQFVKTLYQGNQSAGHHQVVFQAEGLSSGIYFVVLEGESMRLTQKVVLLN